MLNMVRVPARGYRCEKGCWWEEGGCYCPNIALRGSPESRARGIKIIAGIAALGGIFWAINKVR